MKLPNCKAFLMVTKLDLSLIGQREAHCDFTPPKKIYLVQTRGRRIKLDINVYLFFIKIIFTLVFFTLTSTILVLSSNLAVEDRQWQWEYLIKLIGSLKRLRVELPESVCLTRTIPGCLGSPNQLSTLENTYQS